jgi:tetratricopeptide (TPR) repeat protein
MGWLLVFGLAFAVRAAYLLELRGSVLLEVLIGDGYGYDQWARALLAGDGRAPAVFYQAPLYPYFLAAVYRSGGASIAAVLWLQALFGAGACVLLGMAGRILFGARAGHLAGAMLAVYPYALFYGGLVEKSALALFFLCLLVYLLACTRDLPGAWLPAAAGASLGALGLLRENALALLPIVAVWLCVEPRGAPRRSRALRAAAACAGTLLVLAPVAWRNAAHGGGGLLPTSFQLGTNLYAGNYHGASGRYVPPREGGGFVGREESDARQLAEAATGGPLSPAGVSRYWTAKTLEEIRAAPGDWLALMLRKTILVWNAEEVLDTEAPEVYADESLVLRGLASVFHFGVLLPLAAFGIAATAADRRRLWLLYALLAGMAASVVIFFVLGRLRLPLVPWLVLFAAAGIAALPELLRSRGRFAACGACLVAAACVANVPLPGAPVDPRALTWNDLGVALRREGRTPEALAYFERAIQRDPTFYRALLNQAEVLRTQGDPQAAIALAERAVALQPRSAVARQHLAVALKDAGRTDEALAEIRLALAIDPAHLASESLLGLLLIRAGRPAEAIPPLTRYTQRRPGDPRGFNNLGAALAKAGRVAEARDAFRQALRLDPAHAGARRNLAVWGER